MKFFCDYCGCRINAEKHEKCPNCGASYKKNETFLRLEKEKREKEAALNKEMEDSKKNTKVFMKIFSIIFISIFVIVFVSIIGTMIGIGRIGNKVVSDIPNQIQNLEEKEVEKKPEKVTVSMNEYAKVGDYQVKVTGYDKVTFWYKEAKEGYEYIKFNLMVENLTNKSIYKENVNCIVDGVAQTNEFTSGYSTLPPIIDSNLTVTGESTYEVPKNAKSYDVRYGDYAIIHIEK